MLQKLSKTLDLDRYLKIPQEFIAGLDSDKVLLRLVLKSNKTYYSTRKYYLSRYDDLEGEKEEPKKRGDAYSANYNSSNDFSIALRKVIETALPTRNVVEKYWQALIFSISLVNMFSGFWLTAVKGSLFGLEPHLICYVPVRMLGFQAGQILMIGYQLIFSIGCTAWMYKQFSRRTTHRLDVIPFMLVDSSTLADLMDSNANGSQILNPYDCLVQTLYIKTNSAREQTLILKPNRTLEVRSKLINKMRWIVAHGRIHVILLICFSILSILRNSLFDSNYIKNYPGCMPELDQLAQQGKLNWSITILPFNHHTLRVLIDFIVENVYFIDAIFAGLSVVILLVLITDDLLIYWIAIRKKLDWLVDKLKSDHYTDLSEIYQEASDTISTISSSLSIGHNSLCPLDLVSSILESEKSKGIKLQHQQGDELCKFVQILQELMIDFFAQLKYYDRFISTLIKILFLSWIGVFIVISYSIFNETNRATVSVLRMTQIYSLIVLIPPVWVLLRIRGATKDAYPIICTAMCFETVRKRKEMWSRVLEFYTDNNRFGFSFFNSYQLSWIVMLNVVGLSVSVIAILDSFRRY